MRLAALVLVLTLPGCAALLPGVAGAVGGFGLSEAIQADIALGDLAIRAGCGAYRGARLVTERKIAAGSLSSTATAKARAIEEYGDAACLSPPTGDALSTAVWLGSLVGELAALEVAKIEGK